MKKGIVEDIVGGYGVDKDSVVLCMTCDQYFLGSIVKNLCPICDNKGDVVEWREGIIVKVKEREIFQCHYCHSSMRREFTNSMWTLTCCNCGLRTPSFVHLNLLLEWWEKDIVNRSRKWI